MEGSTGGMEERGGPTSDGSEPSATLPRDGPPAAFSDDDGSDVPDGTPEADPVAGLRRDLFLQACPYLEPAPGTSPVDGVAAPRCVSASGDPWPLPDRQRTLVCLTEGHLECPRYHRAVAPDGLPAGAARHVPRATMVATLVLALSLATAVGSMAMNGGIRTPTTSPHPDPTEVAAASVGSASAPAATPVGSSPGSPTTSPSVAGSPSPARSPAPTPLPSPGSSSASTPSPRATSDRYALLVACPGKPGCYTYTVRAGDNLTSIGLYFGVPFATILRLNPWIRDPTTIRRGQVLVLPPPTR